MVPFLILIAPYYFYLQQLIMSIIKITIRDASDSFKQIQEVTATTTLKELRAMISIPKIYDDFTFLDKDSLIPIGRGSEQKALANNYTKDNFVTIKFSKKQVEPTIDKNDGQAKNQEKIEKTMKTKALVEGWISELEKFESKNFQDAKEKQKYANEKLERLRSQLLANNIEFSLQSSTKYQDVIENLKRIRSNSIEYINELKNSTFFSNKELAKRFSNDICSGYLREVKRNIQILDIQKSIIFEDYKDSKVETQDFQYQSEQIAKNHITKVQNNCTGGSLSMMGGSPFFFLKGSASYQSAWKQKTQSTNETKYTSYVKTKFASKIGLGIKFTSDSIQITDDFHQSYKRIYQIFKRQEKSMTNPSQRFMKKAQEFFELYGQSVQTGTYYLGSTYRNMVSCNFTKQQTLESAQILSSSALSVSVAGGGIFSGGFFAAKGSLNINKEEAIDKRFQQLNSQMKLSKNHLSHPFIQDMDKWVEVVSTTNGFWRILYKIVENTSIFTILRNNRNLKVMGLSYNEVDDFQGVLMNCYYRGFQNQQGDVIQLDGETFLIIPRQIDDLNSKQKETKILRITRRNKQVTVRLCQCTNDMIKSQLFLDEGCKQTLIKGKMKIMQSYKSHYLVRKAETIQTVISVIKQSKSSTIQSYFFFYWRMQENINSEYNKIYQEGKIASQPRMYRSKDCSRKSAINKEALLAVSKNFGRLEKLIIIANIPVINSLAMREFARSLRKMPNLKLQVVVDKVYQADETNPNWTHETVLKGEVIYQ